MKKGLNRNEKIIFIFVCIVTVVICFFLFNKRKVFYKNDNTNVIPIKSPANMGEKPREKEEDDEKKQESNEVQKTPTPTLVVPSPSIQPTVTIKPSPIITPSINPTINPTQVPTQAPTQAPTRPTSSPISNVGEDRGNYVTRIGMAEYENNDFITEIHFLKLDKSEIIRRYNASPRKNPIYWDVTSTGDVKAWMEGSKLIIASHKKIFLKPSGFKQSVYFGSYICGYDAQNCYAGNHGAGFPNLQVINFENVDTSMLTGMHKMFSGARKLRQIMHLDNFNTSNVTDMYGMFENNSSLTTLDLSSFDTSKVTDMSFMFANTALTKIYVSQKWTTSKVQVHRYIFTSYRTDVYPPVKYTSRVIGGNGTICNNTIMDLSVAHIDIPGNPGCLTLKK